MYIFSSWNYHYPSGGMIFRVFDDIPNLNIEPIESVPSIPESGYTYIQNYSVCFKSKDSKDSQDITDFIKEVDSNKTIGLFRIKTEELNYKK